MLFNTLTTLLAVAACAAGAPLEKRAVVPHDSLSPHAESIRTGAEGTAIKTFEPYLHIAHGCQPYPAVDDQGNVSGGLQDSGSSTGGCRDETKGQTYVRGGAYRGRYAIMYAWYMPKDQPNSGNVAGGHRHDWEHIVVWLDDANKANPTLLGAAASSHSGYTTTKTPQTIDGTHPQVEYFTNFPTDHELQFKTSPGKEYPMWDWATMPDVTKNALATTNWGKANVPFIDANWEPKLDKAWVE